MLAYGAGLLAVTFHTACNGASVIVCIGRFVKAPFGCKDVSRADLTKGVTASAAGCLCHTGGFGAMLAYRASCLVGLGGTSIYRTSTEVGITLLGISGSIGVICKITKGVVTDAANGLCKTGCCGAVLANGASSLAAACVNAQGVGASVVVGIIHRIKAPNGSVNVVCGVYIAKGIATSAANGLCKAGCCRAVLANGASSLVLACVNAQGVGASVVVGVLCCVKAQLGSVNVVRRVYIAKGIATSATDSLCKAGCFRAVLANGASSLVLTDIHAGRIGTSVVVAVIHLVKAPSGSKDVVFGIYVAKGIATSATDSLCKAGCFRAVLANGASSLVLTDIHAGRIGTSVVVAVIHLVKAPSGGKDVVFGIFLAIELTADLAGLGLQTGCGAARMLGAYVAANVTNAVIAKGVIFLLNGGLTLAVSTLMGGCRRNPNDLTIGYMVVGIDCTKLVSANAAECLCDTGCNRAMLAHRTSGFVLASIGAFGIGTSVVVGVVLLVKAPGGSKDVVRGVYVAVMLAAIRTDRSLQAGCYCPLTVSGGIYGTVALLTDVTDSQRDAVCFAAGMLALIAALVTDMIIAPDVVSDLKGGTTAVPYTGVGVGIGGPNDFNSVRIRYLAAVTDAAGITDRTVDTGCGIVYAGMGCIACKINGTASTLMPVILAVGKPFLGVGMCNLAVGMDLAACTSVPVIGLIVAGLIKGVRCVCAVGSTAHAEVSVEVSIDLLRITIGMLLDRQQCAAIRAVAPVTVVIVRVNTVVCAVVQLYAALTGCPVTVFVVVGKQIVRSLAAFLDGTTSTLIPVIVIIETKLVVMVAILIGDTGKISLYRANVYGKHRTVAGACHHKVVGAAVGCIQLLQQCAAVHLTHGGGGILKRAEAGHIVVQRMCLKSIVGEELLLRCCADGMFVDPTNHQNGNALGGIDRAKGVVVEEVTAWVVGIAAQMGNRLRCSQSRYITGIGTVFYSGDTIGIAVDTAGVQARRSIGHVTGVDTANKHVTIGVFLSVSASDTAHSISTGNITGIDAVKEPTGGIDPAQQAAGVAGAGDGAGIGTARKGCSGGAASNDARRIVLGRRNIAMVDTIVGYKGTDGLTNHTTGLLVTRNVARVATTIQRDRKVTGCNHTSCLMGCGNTSGIHTVVQPQIHAHVTDNTAGSQRSTFFYSDDAVVLTGIKEDGSRIAVLMSENTCRAVAATCDLTVVHTTCNGDGVRHCIGSCNLRVDTADNACRIVVMRGNIAAIDAILNQAACNKILAHAKDTAGTTAADLALVGTVLNVELKGSIRLILQRIAANLTQNTADAGVQAGVVNRLIQAHVTGVIASINGDAVDHSVAHDTAHAGIAVTGAVDRDCGCIVAVLQVGDGIYVGDQANDTADTVIIRIRRGSVAGNRAPVTASGEGNARRGINTYDTAGTDLGSHAFHQNGTRIDTVGCGGSTLCTGNNACCTGQPGTAGIVCGFAGGLGGFGNINVLYRYRTAVGTMVKTCTCGGKYGNTRSRSTIRAILNRNRSAVAALGKGSGTADQRGNTACKGVRGDCPLVAAIFKDMGLCAITQITDHTAGIAAGGNRAGIDTVIEAHCARLIGANHTAQCNALPGTGCRESNGTVIGAEAQLHNTVHCRVSNNTAALRLEHFYVTVVDALGQFNGVVAIARIDTASDTTGIVGGRYDFAVIGTFDQLNGTARVRLVHAQNTAGTACRNRTVVGTFFDLEVRSGCNDNARIIESKVTQNTGGAGTVAIVAFMDRTVIDAVGDIGGTGNGNAHNTGRIARTGLHIAGVFALIDVNGTIGIIKGPGQNTGNRTLSDVKVARILTAGDVQRGASGSHAHDAAGTVARVTGGIMNLTAVGTVGQRIGRSVGDLTDDAANIIYTVAMSAYRLYGTGIVDIVQIDRGNLSGKADNAARILVSVGILYHSFIETVLEVDRVTVQTAGDTANILAGGGHVCRIHTESNRYNIGSCIIAVTQYAKQTAVALVAGHFALVDAVFYHQITLGGAVITVHIGSKTACNLTAAGYANGAVVFTIPQRHGSLTAGGNVGGQATCLTGACGNGRIVDHADQGSIDTNVVRCGQCRCVGTGNRTCHRDITDGGTVQARKQGHGGGNGVSVTVQSTLERAGASGGNRKVRRQLIHAVLCHSGKRSCVTHCHSVSRHRRLGIGCDTICDLLFNACCAVYRIAGRIVADHLAHAVTGQRSTQTDHADRDRQQRQKRREKNLFHNFLPFIYK